MQETGSNTAAAISVQVSLSGYVTRVSLNGVSVSSGWMSADRFFTDPQFRRGYDEVSVSLFTPKFVLVPEHFFQADRAGDLLSEVAALKDSDAVSYEAVPQFKAVLIYSDSWSSVSNI